MKTYLSQLTIQGVLFFLRFACNEPHLFNVIFLGEILKSGARCGPGGERYSVEDLDYMTSFEFQSFFLHRAIRKIQDKQFRELVGGSRNYN